MVDEHQVDLGEILPVAPDLDIPDVRVEEAVLTELRTPDLLRAVGTPGHNGEDEIGLEREVEDHLVDDRFKPPPLRGPHLGNILGEELFSIRRAQVAQRSHDDRPRRLERAEVLVEPRNHLQHSFHAT